MKTKYFKPISNRLLKVFSMLLFICAFGINNAHAQAIQYYYDNNGNRISELVVVLHKSAINNDSTSCITVYPNPTVAQVNVSIPCIQNCGDATVYVSDGSGNLISTQKLTSTISQVNLTSYTQGIYYLRIIMCNEQYTYKVIKTNPGGTGGSPTTPTKPHINPPVQY